MIFYTIKGDAEARLSVKGSKFIARLWPVADEKEIEEKLKYLRKKYYDATHHCFAWKVKTKVEHKVKIELALRNFPVLHNLGDGGSAGEDRFRYSDDGEPSGTAGKPIYNILGKYNVTNVLAVVTRYYGGTKLGTGGLVRAYSEGAEEAFKNAEIIKIEKGVGLQFNYSYELQSPIDRVLRDIKNIRHSKTYKENISLTLECHEEDVQTALDKIRDASKGKILGSVL